MGRPVNQKYFGNYNSNKMGGESVASVTVNTAGSYANSLPTMSFSGPSFPGHTATGNFTGKAVSASVPNAGNGYLVNDILTAVGGTGGAAATFTVTALKAVSVTVNPNISHRGTGFHVGDIITLANAAGNAALGTTPVQVQVTQVGSGIGEIQGLSIYNAGIVPTNEGLGPFNDFSHTGSGAGVRDFTVVWGVAQVSVHTVGSYIAVNNSALNTTGGSGSGATLNVNYGVASVNVTNGGDGYISVADAAISFSPTGAVATPVLTSNQNNAIIVQAVVNSVLHDADVVQQIGTKAYRVTTAEGTGVCTLVASTPANAGEMAINANDSDGGTYWVIKLTSRHALLIQNTGTQFDNHTLVRWSFDPAVAGYSVVLDNA